ncbi:MAG: hypothetical protein A2Y86_09220 [Candidatus Aminicenantes bacterium RBG_13_62_12]|nr:MAG: hypothetical protein A2Y86_09220 [Candidatus Aminicenantes bacterium RBG_13_62_12]
MILPALVLVLALASPPAVLRGRDQTPAPAAAPAAENLLKLLGVSASDESMDYVANKTQFQLHTLLTEQRHPLTWNLSEKIRADTAAGLEMLFTVDEDIAARLDLLAAEPAPLEELSREVESAMLEKRRIYVYGCGATGRLAKQMESSFWRPFWSRLKRDETLWPRLRPHLAADIEGSLIGEMTGGDRALISSLEGFEDLQLIGRLQLEDRGIKKGDLVICVTEGGETSSVIGTVLAALAQWKSAAGYSPAESRKRLYFIYNNPDDRLRPFARSRTVLDEPGITKVNLTTGPQAITGSTRMQATTIETFVVGSLLQKGAERALRRLLGRREVERVGFKEDIPVTERLKSFRGILREVREAVPSLSRFTDLEAETYAAGRFSTYFAGDGLIAVFIDSTERSPTFRLYPLDTVNEPARKCWIQVWTPAPSKEEAWLAFLGRPFRGLAAEFYRRPFEEEIEDPYLKAKALESLKNAGDDQRLLYDFSFSETNRTRRGPGPGDLGVAACLPSDEPILEAKNSPVRDFCDLFLAQGSRPVLISIGGAGPGKTSAAAGAFLRSYEKTGGRLQAVSLGVSLSGDPFQINAHIALKMLLNAHSTAVMAKLGRVVGNTMTNVSPSNLKLIGRATYLIQSHVNDVLSRPVWVRLHGPRKPVAYGEANAVLFDSIVYLRDRPRQAGQTAEVALSIVRILESLKRNKALPHAEALAVVNKDGLDFYLSRIR